MVLADPLNWVSDMKKLYGAILTHTLHNQNLLLCLSVLSVTHRSDWRRTHASERQVRLLRENGERHVLCPHYHHRMEDKLKIDKVCCIGDKNLLFPRVGRWFNKRILDAGSDCQTVGILHYKEWHLYFNIHFSAVRVFHLTSFFGLSHSLAKAFFLQRSVCTEGGRVRAAFLTIWTVGWITG